MYLKKIILAIVTKHNLHNLNFFLQNYRLKINHHLTTIVEIGIVIMVIIFIFKKWTTECLA